jgi:hypothetical protein
MRKKDEVEVGIRYRTPRTSHEKRKGYSMKNDGAGGSGVSPFLSLICRTVLETRSLGSGW